MLILRTAVIKKITEFVVTPSASTSGPQAIKRTSSILSSPESTREVKKVNREMNMEVEEEQVESIEQAKEKIDSEGDTTIMLDQHNLQQILGPLMKEFRSLGETVDKNYKKLEEVQKEIARIKRK